MNRRLIAFDLDGTLTVSKSPIPPLMADRLRELLFHYDVCIISGGKFDQFRVQVIDRLEVSSEQLARLHIMPTSGTSYYRFVDGSWVVQYTEDLTPQRRVEIADVLMAGATELGYWESDPFGEVIEDRGSQVTFSALGQEAPPENKYAWDPDGAKKEALRAYVAARLPDLEVRVGGTTSIDVTREGIDKAYGMRKLMAALDLTSDDILFFGDKLDEGGNDFPVKSTGIDTIAVGNWEDTALALEAIIQVS
ncbi:MAG: HAD family hydrolase [Actinobacteria bacterium RBG_16_68_21]|nr:MAG: HAD family hydrolase [Actinobacteria bacterium RBG_16_68_21]